MLAHPATPLLEYVHVCMGCSDFLHYYIIIVVQQSLQLWKRSLFSCAPP